MDWKDFFMHRLQQRREELGLSKSELARQIGTRHVTIVEFEKGRKFPAVDTLVALARVLDVSTDWLLGLSDDPHAPSLPKGGDT